MNKYLLPISLTSLLTISCINQPDSSNNNDYVTAPIATVAPSKSYPSFGGSSGTDYGGSAGYVSSNQEIPEPGAFDQQGSEDEPIHYHGGPVMVAPANIYFIWYGDWKDSKVPVILEDMASNLKNSDWFDINSSYFEKINEGFVPVETKSLVKGQQGHIQELYTSTKVNFVQSVYNSYSHGKNLTEFIIRDIIHSMIDTNQLPLDSDGVYVMLTSQDVNDTEPDGLGGTVSFCSDFCGWHNHKNIAGVDLKYLFVGDSMKCSKGCTVKAEYLFRDFYKSPNDSWSADGMASVFAHELSETIVDPNPLDKTAWRDSFGYETADKCAWTYGTLYLTADAESVANVKIGDRDFLIQQNWVLDNAVTGEGHCGLHR